MRQNRNAQTSIFDFYAAHELGDQLKTLSDILDDQPGILALVEEICARRIPPALSLVG